MLERFTRVPLGTVQVARVAVCDREIAFGERNEILVSLGQPHMQGTRRRADAFAQFATLGLAHGLAAVTITVEPYTIAAIQQLPLRRERLQGLCVAQPCLRTVEHHRPAARDGLSEHRRPRSPHQAQGQDRCRMPHSRPHRRHDYPLLATAGKPFTDRGARVLRPQESLRTPPRR